MLFYTVYTVKRHVNGAIKIVNILEHMRLARFCLGQTDRRTIQWE